ncbi:OsmC family protein [Swaminathania salitolerans]|uniref:Peroxiredoxin n=1 Tax=Swaminathania salitolerans TaxID=182838 RepID=A0A511BNZ4_9PROT|nr:OsmC family protein [Swaminathania salitolerans]GBQ15283.1 OsmC-like protein [Swaminathania salitolerans LMG 21291]GEL02051.1 peroxiredoxin [Swaminathania salitolerans]
MPAKRHIYTVETEWTGNHGLGTRSWHVYGRNHVIVADGKPAIQGSADPSFHGDPTGWNPGELLLASLSACHKLWYLGLCAGAGIVVTAYRDHAEAVMVESPMGEGVFESALLRPHISLSGLGLIERAQALHDQAHAHCFIARSVTFPVICEPVFQIV